MALPVESGADHQSLLHITPSHKALLATVRAFSDNVYAISANTGIISAGLAANSSVFALRTAPGNAKPGIRIRRMILDWGVSTNFTTPITADRRLAIFRGSGAAASGGTSLPNALVMNADAALCPTDTASGGDVRIATTGALTVTGITYETTPIATMLLVGHGVITANQKIGVFDFGGTGQHPLVLRAGELIGIRNPAAMDAAGVWGLGVTVLFEREE